MKKAIIGYGGHAREVMAQMGKKLICFVDDQFVCKNTKPLSEFDEKKFKVIVAIGDSKKRHDIVQKLPKGTKFFTWVHPTALILDRNIQIGEGSFIGANTIVTTNVKIGKHSILNRSNNIGHDCEVGDFFSAMPGSIVSGNVKIHDCVYLGSNSSIREKITINSNVIIGSNSAVVKDIIDPGVYGGVPTKRLNL